MGGIRLDWDDKSADVPRLNLPLQIVETVNSPRADRGTIFESAHTDPSDGWRNRLIWGDNVHVLASLAQELSGKVDLVYIDPPFDSRQDYKVRIAVGDGPNVGDQELAKIASVIEEKAYRDTWGKGMESYLQMLYSRLILIRELLSDRGSLFLHLAPNVSHLARVLLDEVFGPDNFRAEIVWKRTTAHSDGGQGSRQFGPVHDVILYFSKTDQYIWNSQTTPHDDAYIASKYPHVEEGSGRRYGLWDMTGPGGASKGNPSYEVMGVTRYWRYSRDRMQKLIAEGRVIQPRAGAVPRFKRYLDESSGVPLQDVWADIDPINSQAIERLGYDTQKPVTLLERIIKSSTDKDSVVLDCFVGSGTTVAVAEKLDRRWIAVDIGRFAIHTTRKRLLDLPGCSPFAVANLGRYERQVWQQATTGEAVRAYLDFVVTLFGAAPVAGFQHVHGTLGATAVHVGAVDAPISLAEIKDAIDEAADAGYPSLDVLGWEFEMGLHDLVQDVARAAGTVLRLRRIPREVMDPRAVESGEVVFHELAYVKVDAKVRKRSVDVCLTEFVLPNPELIPASVRDKVTGWSDYVDYWAVDFTFGAEGEGDTFRNQWQSYRTRTDRGLELVAQHDYEEPGKYSVLVKVVDIFGNDTTTSVSISVK
ncbi:site-specific DNA-methyltransferase [Kribbella sp. NBC_01245]|uniref:site-specific DNA-methyltransferase n=1 Tax=Kribbella sp. NBC_01245 TaxID=2903578 RepID=UPI002E28399C|nr:site-specific DNA-methyltransferase [Kribbella sp. NBC_01245]